MNMDTAASEILLALVNVTDSDIDSLSAGSKYKYAIKTGGRGGFFLLVGPNLNDLATYKGLQMKQRLGSCLV